MTRAITLGLAIVLALVLAAGSAQAKKRKVKVETEVTLDVVTTGPWEASWAGEVISSKPRCARNRLVDVSYVRPEDPFSYGTTRTEADGSYEVEIQKQFLAGEVEATAAKRKLRKKRRVIVCKAATSPPYQWP